MRSFACLFAVAALVFVPYGASLCGAPDAGLVRWDVYRDAETRENHGHWTNYMPEQAGKMLKVNMACKTDPQAGATCIRVDVRWQDPFWCGVAVSCAPDYWGETNRAAFDLRRARKLVFYARGEKGEEMIEVKAGIIGDKPYGDSAKESVSSGWIALRKSWQRYEVDVSTVDMSRCVTPFAFVASKDRNGRDITFFLDEIHYLLEGGK
jgi:hypothetical protein